MKIPFFFPFILISSLYFIVSSFPSACMQGVVPYLSFVLLFIHFLPHLGDVPYLLVILLFINFLYIFFFLISNALVNISSLVYNMSSISSRLFLFYSLFSFFVLNVLIIDVFFKYNFPIFLI